MGRVSGKHHFPDLQKVLEQIANEACGTCQPDVDMLGDGMCSGCFARLSLDAHRAAQAPEPDRLTREQINALLVAAGFGSPPVTDSNLEAAKDWLLRRLAEDE